MWKHLKSVWGMVTAVAKVNKEAEIGDCIFLQDGRHAIIQKVDNRRKVFAYLEGDPEPFVYHETNLAWIDDDRKGFQYSRKAIIRDYWPWP